VHKLLSIVGLSFLASILGCLVASSILNTRNWAPLVSAATKNRSDRPRTTNDKESVSAPALSVPARASTPAPEPCLRGTAAPEPSSTPEPVQLVTGTPGSFEKSVTNSVALFAQADRDRNSLIQSTLAVKRMLTFELPNGQTFSQVIEVPVFHRQGVHYIDGASAKNLEEYEAGLKQVVEIQSDLLSELQAFAAKQRGLDSRTIPQSALSKAFQANTQISRQKRD